MTDYDTLITHELIAEAQAKLDATRSRLATVRNDLAASQARHDAAKAASDAAVAGDGTDPHKAATGLATAASAVDVCGQIVAAAERALAQADAGVVTARGIAHQPVYLEGIRQRLAAAKRADFARAELSAAEADYTAATGILNYATRQGTRDVVFDRSHGHVITTYADELNRWTENFHNAWFKGLDEAGNIKE